MINDVLMRLGSWEVLLSGAPREITSALDHFGHVAITDSRIDIRAYGDEALKAARYVGVKRAHKRTQGGFEFSGVSMAVWLGDEDDKGAILEEKVQLAGANFATAIGALLPESITEGTLYAVNGSYSGTHRWESPRNAIEYVCDVFGAEFRVNGDGTLDAGLPDDLFEATPRAIVLAREIGRDIDITTLEGDTESEADVIDWSSRVVLLAEGEGESIKTGAAEIDTNPYLDLYGNPVKRTRIISESGTSETNAETRAQLHLNRFSSQKDVVRLSSVSHEIIGPVNVGDTVYVYDPDTGFVDPANEVVFRGRLLYPMQLRIVGMSLPVAPDYGVYFRRNDGEWLDLSDWVVYEDGDVTVDVGARGKRLTKSGEDPNPRTNLPDDPTADDVAPKTPEFFDFTTSTYEDAEGRTRAVIRAAWDQPLNEDDTVVEDGEYYVIRYRRIGEQ